MIRNILSRLTFFIFNGEYSNTEKKNYFTEKLSIIILDCLKCERALNKIDLLLTTNVEINCENPKFDILLLV